MNQEHEIVDAQTGEVIETLPAVIEQKMAIANFQGISESPFEPKIAKILTASIPENIIEIRPDDGMIYLPQTEYRRILNNAFGVGGWAIRPLEIKKVDDVVVYSGELWAHGRYIASAMGEQRYIESNKKMSWATAVEGAKSDCITRCCKDIGIAIDLWSPQFSKKWVTEHAVKVWCDPASNSNVKGKWFWRKTNEPPIDRWPYVERATKEPKQQESPPKTADTPPPAPPEPPKTSPAYGEKARMDFVNKVKMVMEEQLPTGMNAEFERGLLIADKTVNDKRTLLKWFVWYICAGKKEAYGEKLLEWSKGRGHTPFSFVDIDAAPGKDIAFAYEKGKAEFKAWIAGLNGEGEPPTLAEVAAGAEKTLHPASEKHG